jgi:hypothetical protein
MGRKRYRQNRDGADDLRRVVSLSEAAQIWRVAEPTLRYHLVQDTLCGRKAGRVWLISVASMVAVYGPPVSDLS